jgi:hypothetical protein
MKKMKPVIIIMLVALLCIAVSGCGDVAELMNIEVNADQDASAQADDGATAKADASQGGYEPLPVSGEMQTAMFEADFIDYGMPCFFNEHEVITSENNPNRNPGGGQEAWELNNFEWGGYDDGSGKHSLMILVDAEDRGFAENYNLYVPEYGVPEIVNADGQIYITWTHYKNPDDMIQLMFLPGSNLMAIMQNPLRQIEAGPESPVIEMAVSVSGDEAGYNAFYIPLYAILNEVGGSVVYDPFGDGMAFITTGDSTQGYSGAWEVADDTEYRVDVEIDGATVSIGNYWWALELNQDGTFLETDRFYQDEGDWVRIEKRGEFAWTGRTLALRYLTETMYRGTDFNNLEKVQEGPSQGSSGDTPGSGTYVWYVEDWTPADELTISNCRELFSHEKAMAAGQPYVPPVGDDGRVNITVPEYFYYGKSEQEVAADTGYEVYQNRDGTYTLLMTLEQWDMDRGEYLTHLHDFQEMAEAEFKGDVEFVLTKGYEKISIFCQDDVFLLDGIFEGLQLYNIGYYGPVYLAYMGVEDPVTAITLYKASDGKKWYTYTFPKDLDMLYTG